MNNDSDIPKELLRNPHFARYYRTWQNNELSIVFIPLAEICREQGFLEIAREICEKGLIHHAASVSGRLMLARVYFDLEKIQEARRIVEKVLEEYPAQQEAQSLSAKILRASSGKAEIHAAKTPRVPDISETLKTTEIKDRREGLEDEDEEPTVIGSVDSNDPVNLADSIGTQGEVEACGVSLWENPTMAKIYADQGETKIARRIVERILSRDPGNARALEMQAELKKTPQKTQTA